MTKGNLQIHEAKHSFTRNGEGALVSANVSHDVTANGITTMSMSINLSEAPVPDRRYAADFVSVVYKDDVVKLIFGQEKLGGVAVRSCVVIAFNTNDVTYFLGTLNAMKNPSLDEIAEQSGVTTIPDLRQIVDEPQQTIALSGNFVLAASSGRSSCMDIYSVSAFAYASVQKTKKIPVDPVVRVDLSTANFIALRNELTRLTPLFPVQSHQEAS